MIKLRVHQPEEQLTMKHKSRPKKFFQDLRRIIEGNRTFEKFRCYEEDKIFDAHMKDLDKMYRESRAEQLRQQGLEHNMEQDEDINTDEDLMVNNKKVILTELRAQIDQFAALGRKAKVS
jgi:hypothetical protein